MAMTQEEKNAAEVRRAALALQQAQQPEKDWEQVEAFYKDKGGPPIRKRVGRYFDSAGERSSIGIAEKNLAAAKRKISRSILAKQLNEYQHAVASDESLPSRSVQKGGEPRTPMDPRALLREQASKQAISRALTPEEMTAGGGPSPVLPEDERFSALPGGGVANSKGDYMSGTRPDGTAWNPDATTMRRLNRSPKERTADEQARVNRVNQNRQMQGDAQRIASGLDRSTQVMQLSRAAEMARIKPTPTNIARHRTLAVGMEQARQTRAERGIAQAEVRALAAQNQIENQFKAADSQSKRITAEAKALDAGLSTSLGSTKATTKANAKLLEKSRARGHNSANALMNSYADAAGERYGGKDGDNKKQASNRWIDRNESFWANHVGFGEETRKSLYKITDVAEDVDTTFRTAGNNWLKNLFGVKRDPYNPQNPVLRLNDFMLLQKVLKGEIEGNKSLGFSFDQGVSADDVLDGFAEAVEDKGEREVAALMQKIAGVRYLEGARDEYADHLYRSTLAPGLRRE